jgi:hypothetical protein
LGGWAFLPGGNSYHPAAGHRQKPLPFRDFLPKNCQNRWLTIIFPRRILNGDDHGVWNVAMPRGLLFV